MWGVRTHSELPQTGCMVVNGPTLSRTQDSQMKRKIKYGALADCIFRKLESVKTINRNL